MPTKSKKIDPVLACTVPSQLIRLALADLALVEKDRKTYRVDMEKWHEPNSHCSVCFAGAVMAMTYKADPTLHLSPEPIGALGLSGEAAYRISLLNVVRNGRVCKFVRYFYAGPNPGFSDARKIGDAHAEKVFSLFYPEAAKYGSTYDGLEAGYRPMMTSPTNATERKLFRKQVTDIAVKLESIGL